MAKSAAVTLAFLLAVFKVGSCIHCYQCNSQTDPTCGDPFKSTKGLVDCTAPDASNYNQLYLRNILPAELLSSIAGAPRYCHKIITESGTIARTCLDGNPNDMNHTCRIMDIATTVAPVKIKYCSVCDRDRCNGAGAAAISLPLATLALIISYLFCKQ